MLPEGLALPLSWSLVPMEPVLLLPCPATVRWSFTLRLPAYDWAIRFAVCRSLAVATLPERSIASLVTFTLTVSLLSVGSFFRAF